jgi:hypothetical protein
LGERISKRIDSDKHGDADNFPFISKVLS